MLINEFKVERKGYSDECDGSYQCRVFQDPRLNLICMRPFTESTYQCL